MTLFVDTSALLPRYLATADTPTVGAALADDDTWVASAWSRAEVLAVLGRATTAPSERADLETRFRADWAACHVVPVDQRCLVRAATISVEFGLAAATAVPLAAADRLPRPVTFLTLDGDQVPAALTLDLDVRPA